MEKIILNNGNHVLVDQEDYERLNKYTWHLSINGYARRRTRVKGKNKGFYMHREIMDVPEGLFVDHINRNKLDNRRSNLRICTKQENNIHRGMKKSSKSIYKGICYIPSRNKWEVRINRQFIGHFNNAEIAALVYDLWAKDIYKDYAITNFPLIN